MRRPFEQVDVFAGAAFAGNPLAVVHDAAGLSGDAMQRLARWTNLSETVFLLPSGRPEADYRLRIFTLAGELPFAGHPTLGACHAWLGAGGEPRDRAREAGRIVQECPAGLVRIRRTGGRLAFAAPPLVRGGPVEEGLVARLAALLGVARDDVLEARWVDNGPGWVGVLLGSAEAVLAVEPAADLEGLFVGVAGFFPAGSPRAYEVRAFFPDERGRTLEDPVTGSLNASLAGWLLEAGRVEAPYVASQGTRIGRRGRIHVDADADGTVWVGGETVTRIRGTIEL